MESKDTGKLIDNMNLSNIILGLSTILTAANIFGQTNSLVADFAKDVGLYSHERSPLDKTNSDGSPGFSWFGGHPDLTVIVDKRQPCPPEYALSVSNTNLFSLTERRFLHEIWSKYRIPNTNVLDSVRTKSGDGYDVGFGTGGMSVRYKVDPTLRGEDYNLKKVAITNYSDWQLDIQQVKHGQLDGLKIQFYGKHGGSILRFSNDKAVGEWFDWDLSGDLRFRARFNHPYPLFENLIMEKGSSAP